MMNLPLGQRMREARLDRGLSKSKAALQIGIDRQTYSRFESGRTVRPSDVIEHKIEQWVGSSNGNHDAAPLVPPTAQQNSDRGPTLREPQITQPSNGLSDSAPAATGDQVQQR